MNHLYTVYQHKNKINGKVYIGITMQEPEKRWGVNGCNYKSSPHFYSAIQKYGWDNFEHNILFTNLTKEEACLKEQELIKQFNSMDRNFGYNSTSSGETCVVNEETRQKISQALMGNKNGFGYPCSEEKRQKLSQNYPNKKKVYCEELNTIFDSVQQCGRELGISATSISKLCRGRGKTLKGYHLKHYDDTINA